MKIHKMFTVLLVAALAMSCTTAFAQRGQGGGGGRGGQGGLVGTSITLAANETVQSELKITGDAVSKLDALRTEYQEKSRDAQSGIQFDPNASQEERTKQREERTKKLEPVNKEYQAKLDALLSAEQKTRLKELAVQRLGFSALLDATIQETLKVSAEQKTKLQEAAPQFGGRGQGGAGGAGGPGGNFQQMQTEALTKMVAVLTPEQKTEFEKMKGKEFDMTAIGFGGGRGQGGAGGTGGAGGQRQRGNGGGNGGAPAKGPEL